MAKDALLGDLDLGTLEERLTEAKQELFNLRFQNATGALDNTAALKQTRRRIARITTELRIREIVAAEAQFSIEENRR